MCAMPTRARTFGVSLSPRYTLHVPTDKDGIVEESLKLAAACVHTPGLTCHLKVAEAH